MEYNQDTGLANVPGTAVTAVPHVSIRWRYESGDGGAGCGVAREKEGCPCVFVDCYLRAI